MQDRSPVRSPNLRACAKSETGINDVGARRKIRALRCMVYRDLFRKWSGFGSSRRFSGALSLKLNLGFAHDCMTLLMPAYQDNLPICCFSMGALTSSTRVCRTLRMSTKSMLEAMSAYYDADDEPSPQRAGGESSAADLLRVD